MARDVKPMPGPWKATRSKLRCGGISTIEVRSDEQRLPVICWPGFDESGIKKSVHFANARLIADTGTTYAVTGRTHSEAEALLKRAVEAFRRIIVSVETADGWPDGETFYKSALDNIGEEARAVLAACEGGA